VVAIASALLQTVASVKLTVGIAWIGALFSFHAHEHAFSSVRDGNHLDIVLSHDVTHDAHEHGPATHLHRSPADDHVVHLARDEARDTRRTPAVALPTSLASARLVITALRVAVALPPPPARPVPPLSRRSVVLRT
jgi:hypothetical protein